MCSLQLWTHALALANMSWALQSWVIWGDISFEDWRTHSMLGLYRKML